MTHGEDHREVAHPGGVGSPRGTCGQGSGVLALMGGGEQEAEGLQTQRVVKE